MKTLLLASACVVVIAGPALACRGSAEYPEIATQLEQSKNSTERISGLTNILSQCQKMHQEGHRQGDMGKLLTSLRILDELKAEIAPWIYEFRPPDAS